MEMSIEAKETAVKDHIGKKCLIPTLREQNNPAPVQPLVLTIKSYTIIDNSNASLTSSKQLILINFEEENRAYVNAEIVQVWNNQKKAYIDYIY